jgi:hypothetical protein
VPVGWPIWVVRIPVYGILPVGRLPEAFSEPGGHLPHRAYRNALSLSFAGILCLQCVRAGWFDTNLTPMYSLGARLSIGYIL